MATTKNILEKIKLAGVLEDIIAKSDGENVTVTYNGGSKTLDTALAEIFASVSAAQNEEAVKALISAEIDKLIDNAPDTYNTLREIAEYIETHETAYKALKAAIGDKADKTEFDTVKATVESVQQTVQGLGALASKNQVSEADLDSALKGKVNAAAEGNHSHENKKVLDSITEQKVKAWDAKADTTEATDKAAGLMPAADKARLDSIGGVFYGTGEAPATMRNGDLFVRVVSED